MTTNLSRLMGILAIILLSSNPVMAAVLVHTIVGYLDR